MVTIIYKSKFGFFSVIPFLYSAILFLIIIAIEQAIICTNILPLNEAFP